MNQLGSILASPDVLVEIQKLRKTSTPGVFVNDKNAGFLTGSSADLLSHFSVS